MNIVTFLLFAGGLILLIIGAEVLIRGATRIARGLGISPLIIGLTVVAFGTSAPELSVSISSALQGSADISVGNVIGSNISNILLILGISAVIIPLSVAQQLIRRDIPIMIFLSLATWGLAADQRINNFEAWLLVALLVIYTFITVRASRRETEAVQAEYKQEFDPDGPISARQWLWNGALVLAGLALLVLGARWLVNSAVTISLALGLSELVVGITVVAVGTSLPEIATSILAALKGERDIAVGNVVGSNIFNLLSVLGISGLISANVIPVSAAAVNFDLPVMVVVALALLPLAFTQGRIARWEGWLLLFYYTAYTAYLLLDAAQHDLLPAFSSVLLWFALPLTLLTLVVTLVNQLRQNKRSGNKTA